MEKQFKLNMVSVRLVHEVPVLSEHKICSPADAIDVLGEYLCDMDREVVCVLNLKSDGTPINGHVVSIGDIQSALINPREILKAAILSNAANMILLHSHPSGNVTPSKADIEMTERMINVGDMMGIPVLDHIIVGAGRKIYSLMENKELDYTPCVEKSWFLNERCLHFSDDFGCSQ